MWLLFMCRQRGWRLSTARASSTLLWRQHGHVVGCDHSIRRRTTALPPFFVRTLPDPHFPLWSYSKKRSKETTLRIDYEDGSFFKLDAPKGMPSPRFPGYLDVILYYGQRDLFVQETTALSVYRIFQALRLDPGNGGNYKQFHRDMERSFFMALITDRFRNPATGERSHVDYFRVMRRMRMARSRQEESIFEFEPLFLQSLRAGYLKRLDFDFCVRLGIESKALAR